MKMENLLQEDSYSRIYQDTLAKRLLFMCHWELTYNCNLNCRHCYICKDSKREEFNLEKAKLVLDELKELGCLHIVFSGGEMFSRRDVFAILKYARKQDFALRLFTNGMLIGEEFAQKISELYPLTVETSIYAASAKKHDEITGVKGSFVKMLACVRALKKYNLKVVVKFMMMQNNKDDFTRVRATAKDMGADFIFDMTLAKKDDGTEAPLRYRLNKDEIKSFFAKANDFEFKKANSLPPFLCSSGLNNLLITPYLDVFPCVGLKIKLGNLRWQSLREVWERSPELIYLRGLSNDNLVECRKCKLIPFCNRCPGMALSEGGNLLGCSKFDGSVAQAIAEIFDERGEVHAG